MDKSKRTTRRPKGFGTVYYRESRKSWVVQLPPVKNPYLGKLQRRTYYVKTEKEANALLKKKIHEIASGIYQHSSCHTVATWMPRWLENTKISIEPSTYNYYNSFIRLHIVPILGPIRLDMLTNQQIQDLINYKSRNGRADGKPGGLSRRSLKYIVDILNGALTEAVAYNFLKQNPLVSVKLPTRIEKNVRSKAFTIEEELRFLEGTKNTPYYYLWRFLFQTGLRRGEALGLRWADIDFDNRTMSIARQITMDGKSICHKDKLKTSGSKAVVIVSESALETLRQYKIHQAELLLQFGQKISDDDFIFRPIESDHFRPDTITKCFKKAVISLGLRKELSLHSTRHTFATRICDSSGNIKIAQTLLRHESINVTAKYINPETKAIEDALNCFDKEFELAQKQ